MCDLQVGPTLLLDLLAANPLVCVCLERKVGGWVVE